MAASMWRMNGLWGRMAGVLVLCTLLLSNEVMCQDGPTTPSTTIPVTNQSGHFSADTGPLSTTAATSVSALSSDAGHQSTTITSPATKTGDTLSTASKTPEKALGEKVSAASAPEDSHASGGADTSSSTGSKSKSVFVGILVTGLLAALGLIVGYFKCQRKPDTKGVKLAEEAYPVDQENQGNTLESVAPLNPPPETQEKPSINGESPEAAKTQTPPPNNGHSTTTKTADTEL